MKNTALITSLMLAAIGCAHAQPVLRDGVLADTAGRTLYVFDKDEAGKSNCAGGCLVAWPAFVAQSAAKAQGSFGLIDANGTRQWTVRGKPLYYFSGDTKAGDRNGDGSGGVWHVVPSGASAAASGGALVPAAD